MILNVNLHLTYNRSRYIIVCIIIIDKIYSKKLNNYFIDSHYYYLLLLINLCSMATLIDSLSSEKINSTVFQYYENLIGILNKKNIIIKNAVGRKVNFDKFLEYCRTNVNLEHNRLILFKFYNLIGKHGFKISLPHDETTAFIQNTYSKRARTSYSINSVKKPYVYNQRKKKKDPTKIDTNAYISILGGFNKGNSLILDDTSLFTTENLVCVSFNPSQIYIPNYNNDVTKKMKKLAENKNWKDIHIENSTLNNFLKNHTELQNTITLAWFDGMGTFTGNYSRSIFIKHDILNYFRLNYPADSSVFAYTVSLRGTKKDDVERHIRDIENVPHKVDKKYNLVPMNRIMNSKSHVLTLVYKVYWSH